MTLKNNTRRLLRRHRRPSQQTQVVLLGPKSFLHANIAIPGFYSATPPGRDFYTYINGKWLATIPVPPYSSSYGVSEEVETYIQKSLFHEIYACQKIAAIGREANTVENKMRDAIGRLALSSLRESKQANSVDFLRRGLRSMGCMQGTEIVGKALGKMCRNNITTIINISISPIGGQVGISMFPGNLGMPHASYYNEVGSEKGNILNKYTELVKRVTKALDYDDLTGVVPIEAEFAKALEYTKMENDSLDLRGAELVKKYRHIPWATIFEGYGIDKQRFRTTTIRLNSPSWFAFLNDQFEALDLENWYSLLALHTIIHAIPYLPPPFDDLHFEFFDKILRGQKEKTPQNILTLNVVKKQMPGPMSYIFVEKYLSPEFKREATRFVRKILDAAARRMKDVDWFSEATRAKAAEKIHAMTLSVGYSEHRMNSPINPPALQTDNLLANIYLLESAIVDESVGHLANGIPKDFWEEGAYTVNAFYYHDMNEILIPAGSFFWPFFEMGRLGWNYGGLGAIIGHEMTHAFDAEGCAYNERGAELPWWTATDREHYKQKTQALISLYGQQKVLGHAVNGQKTLDENLADLGGLAIALDALKGELASATEEERKNQLRDFFVSYAVSWRTKEQAQRRIQRLVMDAHAPIELRVNLVVAQFEEWYKTFDIKTGDHLYIPPEERIRIF
jgi:predicted metalloendopeptidase